MILGCLLPLRQSENMIFKIWHLEHPALLYIQCYGVYSWVNCFPAKNQSLGGVCNDVTTLVRKDGCSLNSKVLNGIWVAFALFLHYTDSKMCLSGGELNNDGLGKNKHMIKGRVLLGWALEEGRDGRVTWNLHFFQLCQPLPIEFILTTPLIQFIYLNIWTKCERLLMVQGEKKNPIIPWNRIWDAHAQKGTKWKFSS